MTKHLKNLTSLFSHEDIIDLNTFLKCFHSVIFNNVLYSVLFTLLGP